MGSAHIGFLHTAQAHVATLNAPAHPSPCDPKTSLFRPVLICHVTLCQPSGPPQRRPNTSRDRSTPTKPHFHVASPTSVRVPPVSTPKGREPPDQDAKSPTSTLQIRHVTVRSAENQRLFTLDNGCQQPPAAHQLRSQFQFG